MVNEKLEEVLIQELHYHRHVLGGAFAMSDSIKQSARSFTFPKTILDEPTKITLRDGCLTGHAYDMDKVARDYEIDINELKFRSPKRRTKPRLFGEGIRDNVGWYIEITG